MQGAIFDIKRFSVHDGPGIRTTVFLKGCPLACAWCHNPEGLTDGVELNYRQALCLGCGRCVRACAPQALALTPQGIVRRPERCTLCGECARVCPSEAWSLVGRRLTAEELVAELDRDRVFFEVSGGGVTFSGGEPLAQPQFLAEALALCGKRGLHRAVDTSGYAPPEALDAVAPLTDLFLFDLKLMDPAAHRERTGVTNEPILRNLRRLAEGPSGIEIRVPVVPGLTDGAENVRALGAFLGRLPRRLPVRLLPYHRAGAAKYRRLGLTCRAQDVREPRAEELAALAARLAEAGVDVRHKEES